MAVDDLIDEGSGASDLPDRMTLGQLRSVYGEGVVNRALEYMESLPEANKRFKESTNKAENYSDGFSDWYTDEEVENKEDMESRWSEGVEEGGLGFDE